MFRSILRCAPIKHAYRAAVKVSEGKAESAVGVTVATKSRMRSCSCSKRGSRIRPRSYAAGGVEARWR
eukprot:1201156-Heterocapsa_arctica.AAC.1